MSERTVHEVFEEKFGEIVNAARKQKGIIDENKVNALINELSLINKQIDKVYERLEVYNIVVLNSPDDDSQQDDELLLDSVVKEDANPSQEKTPVMSTTTKIDDPVHLYLKEIGNYPLLSMEDEVKLAKLIEEGDELQRNTS